MSVNLRLDQMTIEGNLQPMEALWADLTRNAEHFESPAWNEQVLKERAQVKVWPAKLHRLGNSQEAATLRMTFGNRGDVLCEWNR